MVVGNRHGVWWKCKTVESDGVSPTKTKRGQSKHQCTWYLNLHASASATITIPPTLSMAGTSTSLASQLSIGLRRPSPNLDSLGSQSYFPATHSFFDTVHSNSNLRLSISHAKPSHPVVAMAGSGKVVTALPVFLFPFFSKKKKNVFDFVKKFSTLLFPLPKLYLLLVRLKKTHCDFGGECNSS